MTDETVQPEEAAPTTKPEEAAPAEPEEAAPAEPEEAAPAQPEEITPTASADLLAQLDAMEGGEIDPEVMMQLYAESLKDLTEGDVVNGRIIEVRDTEVVVDIGYKSEGLVPIDEFKDALGEINIEAGDDVEVLLVRREDRHGNVVVSRGKAEQMKVWGRIEEAFESEETITGVVTDRVKGGLSVDIGVRAFLPGSQVDLRPVRNLEAMKGEEIEVRVIKVNRRRANVVVSRKAVLDASRAEEKTVTLTKLVPGNILRGVVKNITDYGCFTDLGGIDGLLHITDMSWGRIAHPSEMFEISDEIDVVILNFDPERERVSLGYKQLSEDPWIGVTEEYPVGARMQGKVVSLTDYGAFVELEEGVEGLVHISEMTWKKRIKHPSKLVQIGDPVDIVILDVDESSRRISLGMKQTEPNPWRVIAEKYHEGQVITGRVRNLTDFGAFVEIEDGIDGLIHISDMSWTKRVEHPSEVLQKGQEVEVAVLNVDVERQRLSLGLKQLSPNVWDQFVATHKVGDQIDGVITKLTNFGAFVELEEGLEGLLHVSEISERHVKDPADELKVGEPVQVRILKVETDSRKIALTLRDSTEEATREAAEVESYEPKTKYEKDGTMTLGDLVGNIFGSSRSAAEDDDEDEDEV
ncbi:MAG: 30S ribosomal protein S1 [Acidobacteria bacterium]|nr:30S ribosomal protein S1 [Acidobacteriota bacterium]